MLSRVPAASLLSVLPVSILFGVTLASAAQAPENETDGPWAVMRGCLSVLERFDACSADKRFQAYQQQWIDGRPAGVEKAPVKEIRRRLRAWTRRPGRREQCAIWARREGAAEHIGQASPIAKLTSNEPRTSCESFAKAIDEDRWLPKAIVDAKND